MSVVFQYAGKSNPDKTGSLASVFAQLEPLLRQQPGFRKCRLLTNHNTHQVQMLFYWDGFENGLAFNQGAFARFLQEFHPMLEASGTMVTSLVETQTGC